MIWWYFDIFTNELSLFSTQLTLYRHSNSNELKKDSIHVWKCQKFAKSCCRPTFSQRSKTSNKIPLCTWVYFGERPYHFPSEIILASFSWHTTHHCLTIRPQAKKERLMNCSFFKKLVTSSRGQGFWDTLLLKVIMDSRLVFFSSTSDSRSSRERAKKVVVSFLVLQRQSHPFKNDKNRISSDVNTRFCCNDRSCLEPQSPRCSSEVVAVVKKEEKRVVPCFFESSVVSLRSQGW